MREIQLKIFLFQIVFLFCSCTSENISSFEFDSSNGERINLKNILENKATVFVFLDPECPLSQNYTLTLNNLNHQFENAGIKFYGVIPGNHKHNAVKDFVGKYRIGFNLLLDEHLLLTERINAEKTPEVFVIDKKENIVYSGAIDNWAVDLGKKRAVITENYLLDVLNALTNNLEIKTKSTHAVGCFIEK